MDLYEVIDRVASLLQQRGRLTYRTLKLQFELNDEQLAALTEELIDGQQVAVDEGGKVLVWTGGTAKEEPGTGGGGERGETPHPIQRLDARPEAGGTRHVDPGVHCPMGGPTPFHNTHPPDHP